MRNRKHTIMLKFIACILVMALMVPVSVSAAVPETAMPYASHYLMCYTAYVCAMGNGKLEIWFEVTGTGDQEYLGVTTIFLYESIDNENWYRVDTFSHMDYDQMLLTNAWDVMDYVEYQGVAGRYYKAYVGIWGGPDPGGDSRYIWTSVERAT